MKYFVFIVVICFCKGLQAQNLLIGIFRDYDIAKTSISYTDGSMTIYADSIEIATLLPNEYIDISASKDSIILFLGVQNKGKFKEVRVYQNYAGNSFTVTPKSTNVKARKYQDNLEISSKNNLLKLVNLVEMDNYLCGVVESEVGGGRDLEYYKVQSVISRTYALKYRERHKKEGFELCDRVHCQAYHSKLRFTPIIDSAVRKTHNEVIVDQNMGLVDAYFHANCGGQTCDASYVWNHGIDYLEPFIDTFCIYTKQSRWSKEIDKEVFLKFLNQNYFYPLDSHHVELVGKFEQMERSAFLIHPIYGIPLRDIREHFGLKSTFFSIEALNDKYLISGKGYGHGVGLCQEGAIKMADYEYNYRQILNYYYPFVDVMNLYLQKYFKQNVRNFLF